MAEMADLTRFFAGAILAFEIQIVLAAGEVTWCRLTDEGTDVPRLGWCAWLKTEEFTQDADDAIFAVAA
jgi:predicted component of type VI protein secretion system